MQKTSIEWTDRSCNPVRARRISDGKVGWHCVKHSRGCAFCYSERRNKWLGTALPFTAASADLVELFLDERPLRAVLKLRKPQKIFLCDMTDLFQVGIAESDIDTIFAYMAAAQDQTFQVLTKRAAEMAEYLNEPTRAQRIADRLDHVLADYPCRGHLQDEIVDGTGWPLRNVWIGVSVEDQRNADERIPHLLATPAAVRFLSVEPLLGPVDLTAVTQTVTPGFFGDCLRWHHRGRCHEIEGIAYPTISWVIVGGESGPGARPMHPDWARSIRDQCVAAGVPFHFKQIGAWAECERRGTVYAITHKNGRQVSTKIVYADGRSFDYASNCDGKDGGVAMERWGKKATGRLLDGRTWDQFPTPAAGGQAERGLGG